MIKNTKKGGNKKMSRAINWSVGIYPDCNLDTFNGTLEECLDYAIKNGLTEESFKLFEIETENGNFEYCHNALEGEELAYQLEERKRG